MLSGVKVVLLSPGLAALNCRADSLCHSSSTIEFSAAFRRTECASLLADRRCSRHGCALPTSFCCTAAGRSCARLAHSCRSRMCSSTSRSSRSRSLRAHSRPDFASGLKLTPARSSSGRTAMRSPPPKAGRNRRGSPTATVVRRSRLRSPAWSRTAKSPARAPLLSPTKFYAGRPPLSTQPSHSAPPWRSNNDVRRDADSATLRSCAVAFVMETHTPKF